MLLAKAGPTIFRFPKPTQEVSRTQFLQGTIIHSQRMSQSLRHKLPFPPPCFTERHCPLPAHLPWLGLEQWDTPKSLRMSLPLATPFQALGSLQDEVYSDILRVHGLRFDGRRGGYPWRDQESSFLPPPFATSSPGCPEKKRESEMGTLGYSEKPLLSSTGQLK